MEKVAVVTLVTALSWHDLADLTLPTQRAYAKRLGAEFLVIRDAKFPHPHYDKWQLYDILNDYDRVLYIDADTVVRADYPDLFLTVPPQ